MFNFSIKQLFRQPGKAILFFLLMAASTALVVTGVVMTIENTQRIQMVEDTYSTIGMVEQLPVGTDAEVYPDPCLGTFTKFLSDYGDGYVQAESLDFPGAGYISSPEYRPYYISYLPDMSHTETVWKPKRHILEFTPVKATTGDEGPVEVEITKVLYSNVFGNSLNDRGGCKDQTLHEGDTIQLCQCFGITRYPLQPGEKYVSCVYLYYHCPTHDVDEYVAYSRPHSSQRNPDGTLIENDSFPDVLERDTANPRSVRSPQISHVTGSDFYEKGNPGYRYVQWAEHYEIEDELYMTVATNSMNLLPTWHEENMVIASGREISTEEFAEGAMVCLVPDKLANRNRLSVGDKIDLPLLCSYYGDLSNIDGVAPADLSLLNANGEYYEPFWEQEYEIVGIYTRYGSYMEVGEDMFIIPAKSVQASDENNIAWFEPMSKATVSFEIPNGNITEFNNALLKAVPEAENLDITYDDRGYSEIMKSLDNSRGMALLLLLVGIMAALCIVALLLYFFVAKEKKRTAIERSLGMSKRQCRVSLLAGLMILTIVAAGIGSLCGAVVLDKVQETTAKTEIVDNLESQYTYDTRYSPWAKNRELAENTDIEVETPVTLYFITPMMICCLVLIGALLLMRYSFSIDPIYMLSSKEKN